MPGGSHTVLKAITRHKLLLGIPILLGLGCGWLLTQNLPHRYTAEAILALDARGVQIVSSEVVARLPQDYATLRTELDIITSRSLAEDVVDRLGLVSDRDTLREVDADRAPGGLLGRVIRDAGIGEATRAALRWAGVPDAPYEHSPLPTRADIVDWLLAQLKASNDGRSFTMFVDFTSEQPDRAARIANAIAQGYLDEQVGRKEATTRKAGSRLAEKLGEMRQAAAAADASVMEFRQSSGLIETKGMTVTGQQLSELNTQLAIARADLARTEGKLQMARGNNGNSLPDVLISQTIQDLRTQLSRAEVKLKDSPRLYLQPDLQITIDTYRKQLDAETGRIVTSLAHEVAAARARETSLAASLEHLQADYGQASAGMTHLSDLQREADASRTIYETFLARFKQTIEHEGLAVPDALLITEAQAPASPAFPKKLPFMLIAGLVGTLIGSVAVAVSERLNDRIRDVRQLDAVAGVPVLGILPGVGRLGRLQAKPGQVRDSRIPLTVALQWLRVAVLTSKTPCRVQVVLVTSATAADGKTPLCLSLAHEFGRAGERILVIDTDPYRPRMAATLSGAARLGPGLDFGLGDKVQDFVHVDARSRIHFIATPQPEELQQALRDGAFARLLASARNDYDAIILNVAPVLTSADAAILGKFADLRLFVVRYGRTPWDHMLSALSSLRLCGSPVDGIVVVNAGQRERYQYRGDEAVWDRPNPILVEHGAGAEMAPQAWAVQRRGV